MRGKLLPGEEDTPDKSLGMTKARGSAEVDFSVRTISLPGGSFGLLFSQQHL